jgi:predicted amidohydrolase
MDGNLQKMRSFVLDAKDQGVDIICFPELNITGYWLNRDIYDLAEFVPGESSSAVVKMSEETGLTILAGLAEMGRNGVVYNTCIVASPGGLSGKYRKLHVNEEEIPFFSYGNEVPVFNHPKITFGIEICFDSHFPELSTSLALMGCEVLFFPHASGTTFGTGEQETRQEKKARWLRYLPARAYDNSLNVVVCNQVGNNGAGHAFAGTSMIIDPKGKIITEAKTDDEEMIIADLKTVDFIKVRKEQRYHFFLHYRRPEHYHLKEGDY